MPLPFHGNPVFQVSSVQLRSLCIHLDLMPVMLPHTTDAVFGCLFKIVFAQHILPYSVPYEFIRTDITTRVRKYGMQDVCRRQWGNVTEKYGASP